MCAHVIGAVRGARLDMLELVSSGPTDPAVPWRIDYSPQLRPLRPDERAELSIAWSELAAVSNWDDATLGHVLTLLRETVPSLDGGEQLTALGPDILPPAPLRSTAAHPRGYRGTKQRPVKPERTIVDVRPYLLARRHIDQVLELLGQPRGIDPYVAWRYGVATTAAFEPSFTTYVLPLLAGCSWSEVGAFAALYRAGALADEPTLRAAMIAIACGAPSAADALPWWSYVLGHEPGERVEAAQLVAASRIAAQPAFEADFALELASLAPALRWRALRGLACGASVAYVRSGIAIGAIEHSEVPAGQDDVAALVATTIERLARPMADDSSADFWRPFLWRRAGEGPPTIALLRSPEVSALTPKAAFQLVRFAATMPWERDLSPPALHELEVMLDRVAHIATTIPPDHQSAFVEGMTGVYFETIGASDRSTRIIAFGIELCRRIARPPFAGEGALASPIARLANVEWAPSRFRALLAAPDDSWLALEYACRRGNDAALVGRGLLCLAHRVQELFVATFAASPGALVQTATLATAISVEQADGLLAEYARLPIADPALADAPLEPLCEIVAAIAEAGGPNPIRRGLREHLAGKIALSAGQIRGHRERIVAALDVIRLSAIRQLFERTLASRVGVAVLATEPARHAVAMLAQVGDHRRQLRRLVTATLAGDREWRLRHPKTQAWFARHPKIDRDAWLRGVETEAVIAPIGRARFAVERDPLEALKLGTYVGSCLGRGGAFAYSAAAVVLDANKQVIYARDDRGSVVGRQLVALSEADELVCFAIYGSAPREALEEAFRVFDAALAAQLGIAIFTRRDNRDADYEIAQILAHDWWDDSAIE